jgi:hypothetical protein
MGFTYDFPDVDPTSTAAMSMYKGFVSCPTWAGWEGSSLLASPLSTPPPGSVVSTLDVACLDKPWYPVITVDNLATITTLRPENTNMYCPAYLVLSTEGGPVTPSAAGNLYFQYEVELIEPIALISNA